MNIDEKPKCSTCGNQPKTERQTKEWFRDTTLICTRCWGTFLRTSGASTPQPRCPSCGKSGHTNECPACLTAGHETGRLF